MSTSGLASSGATRCEHRRAPYRGLGAVPSLVVPPPVPSVRCDRECSQSWCIPSLATSRRRPRARDEVSPALRVLPSQLRPPPIDRKFGAGREGRTEREEEDGLGDLVRRPPALHGVHTDHLLPKL